MRIQLSSLVSAILLLAAGMSFGKSNSGDMSYAAYLSGSTSLWERVVASKQSEFDQEASDEKRFELAVAQYGLLTATMIDQDEVLFDKYVGLAEGHLEYFIEAEVRKAESMALLSAVYGLKIGYAGWKGMFLGPKSTKLIGEAMELDSQSPIVWKIYGNNQFFTPEMWGGDPKEAQKAYEKAIALFEERDQHVSNWLYLDTYAWLGQVQAKLGQRTEAIETYEASLAIEKDFNWVRMALLPAVKEQ